uniref:DnaJ heat shock protein family (Hsp40) member C24 n=1 Tax=Sarcophilus harrisii TaxID=9305 RepID=A0A7N4NJG5_SARHA
MRPGIPSADYPENATCAHCDTIGGVRSSESPGAEFGAQNYRLTSLGTFLFSIPSASSKRVSICYGFAPACPASLSPLLFDWQYHPDKQSADVPAGAVQECVQKFIEIDQAWKILGNEETKKAYDLQRREDDLRTVGPVDAQIYLEDMLWNKDDQCFTLSCRCGGKYCVSKDEAEEVNLICCDTCSLIIEIVQHS